MTRIPKSLIRAARVHAKEALEHGKTIERLGLAVQHKGDKDCGQFIKECGKCVQHRAEEIRLYAQAIDQVEDTYAIQVYGRAVDAHVKATTIHIASVRLYTLRMKQLLVSTRQRRINSR